MAVPYDESVIIKEAERLYKQARGLALRIAFVYTLIGAIFGAVMMMLPAASESSCLAIGGNEILIAGAVFGLLGWSSGQAKGQKLRMEAQLALCQVAIERNTRPPQAG